MIRLKVYTIPQILKIIPKNIKDDSPIYQEFIQTKVNINKLRYKNFLNNGTTCKECGLKGEYFALEKEKEDMSLGVLNLYGIKDNREIIISSVTSKRYGRYPVGTILCIDCQQTLVSHSKSIFNE